MMVDAADRHRRRKMTTVDAVEPRRHRQVPAAVPRPIPQVPVAVDTVYIMHSSISIIGAPH